MELKSSINLGLVREKALELLKDFEGIPSDSYIVNFNIRENEYKYLVVSLTLPTTITDRNEFGVMKTRVSEMKMVIPPSIETSTEHIHELFYDDVKFDFVLNKINGNGIIENIYFCQGCSISEMNTPSYNSIVSEIELTIKMDYYSII